MSDDSISRQAAINTVSNWLRAVFGVNSNANTIGVFRELRALPSAEPVRKPDEWCTDCKEYDHEKNCCPRFNRVIKSALKDAEPQDLDNIATRHEEIGYDRGFRDGYAQAVTDAEPTIDPEPHWIPVTERLPGPVTYVLVADPGGDMALAKIVDTVEGLKWDINTWVNDLEDWPVWMPLPEPWKGEQNEP